MKTSELTGQQLDYWVAKAQGWGDKEPMALKIQYYTPSTNSAQCFELMQLPEFKWAQTCDARVATGDTFVAKFEGNKLPFNYGTTLNIAICRAFVASVYGEEVIYEQN